MICPSCGKVQPDGSTLRKARPGHEVLVHDVGGGLQVATSLRAKAAATNGIPISTSQLPTSHQVYAVYRRAIPRERMGAASVPKGPHMRNSISHPNNDLEGIRSHKPTKFLCLNPKNIRVLALGRRREHGSRCNDYRSKPFRAGFL